MNAKMEPAAVAAPFDRAAESIGNIVLMEHVNLRQDDQRLATLFYVGGLGLTRDPYLHASEALATRLVADPGFRAALERR